MSRWKVINLYGWIPYGYIHKDIINARNLTIKGVRESNWEPLFWTRIKRSRQKPRGKSAVHRKWFYGNRVAKTGQMLALTSFCSQAQRYLCAETCTLVNDPDSWFIGEAKAEWILWTLVTRSKKVPPWERWGGGRRNGDHPVAVYMNVHETGVIHPFL